MRSSAPAVLFLGAFPLPPRRRGTFDSLRARPANSPRRPTRRGPAELDDFWKNLTYDQHRDIRFKMESGLVGEGARDRFPSTSSTPDGRRRKW